MAKLTARGGVIVARAYQERETPNGDLTIWERESRAVRQEASGTLRTLSKRDVRFKPDAKPYPGEELGRYHSYGWNVRGKLKDGVTVQEWVEAYKRLGWTVTLD